MQVQTITCPSTISVYAPLQLAFLQVMSWRGWNHWPLLAHSQIIEIASRNWDNLVFIVYLRRLHRLIYLISLSYCIWFSNWVIWSDWTVWLPDKVRCIASAKNMTLWECICEKIWIAYEMMHLAIVIVSGCKAWSRCLPSLLYKFNKQHISIQKSLDNTCLSLLNHGSYSLDFGVFPDHLVWSIE